MIINLRFEYSIESTVSILNVIAATNTFHRYLLKAYLICKNIMHMPKVLNSKINLLPRLSGKAHLLL